MTARDILDELDRRHVVATVGAGGKLNFKPHAAIDADLEAAIREQKQEVVALVAAAERAPRGSQAQRLTEIAETAEVFRAADGDTAFASVEINGHRETWRVRSRGFRHWLTARFYATEKKPAGAQALADALSVVEARAQFEGGVRPVHVRFAAHDGAIYLDLVDETWEAVEITARGWRVVAEPPVRFRRARGMLPLPRPERGGSLGALRDFVNVRDDAQWCLLVAWLVGAARPAGPYPVLVLGGEQGSAKSTTAEVLRRLIDPSSAMLRAEPHDARDLMIAASNGWVIALDNLSVLPAWLSDALCRLATGGGLATRELYSDSDEVIFEAQRPVILNGIEEIVTRPDLLDRAILLDLGRIDRVRPVAAVWSDFEAARPRLLGALLDVVSTALAREPGVKLDRLPRLADFALWVTAAAPALGWREDHFLSVYDANRAAAHEVALAASPVAGAVRALADREDWCGTATELLATLAELVDEQTRRARGWPKTARSLSGSLRRLAPNLRAVGVAVGFPDCPDLGPRRRQVHVKKAPVQDRSDRSDRSGAVSRDAQPLPENDPPFQGNDPPLRGNAGSAGQNDPNGANGRAAAVSAEPEVLDL